MSGLLLGASFFGSITGVALFLSYMYSPEIKSMINTLSVYVSTRLLGIPQLSIDTSGYSAYKMTRALNAELMEQCQNQIVIDGGNLPTYELGNNIYRLSFKDSTFYINVEDDKTTLISTCDIAKQKQFLEYIYTKHNRTSSVVSYRLSNGENWNTFVNHSPRQNIRITNDMQRMLDDVRNFISSRELYIREGWSYRRGYLLHGAKGTGKSTMVEKIAIEYDMTCYKMNLNASGMTDAVFIGLICSVPPNSVIVIDEMDKQWKTILQNRNVNISEGGILDAIGGTPSLNDGVIVILIVNDIAIFNTKEWEPLIRPGRIDKVYHFKEKV